ncbi:MAG: formate dehydrogenase accessory sulfurtransferase FdhD [Alphaproteobacteria bacterium]|jgi:FdhD protein|nr:formate dehydrogenase accessory sulfurtransferase FdhD [Alphaproteobacteria bacterium]
MTRLARSVPARRLGQAEGVSLAVPEELPVAMVYDDVSYAVMMATPADLEDFAYGFSLTDGMIAHGGEIDRVAVNPTDQGMEIAITLADSWLETTARPRRLTAGSACGLCGVDALAKVKPVIETVPRRLSVPRASIVAAVRDLADHQPLNRETHSVHAAAWADTAGRILLAREDIGRHNALDKLVGALMRAGIDPAGGFCLITSRCSYEMVQKAVAYGIEMLVAVSGPSGLALDLAATAGLTLVAIARDDGQTVFAGGERIT